MHYSVYLLFCFVKYYVNSNIQMSLKHNGIQRVTHRTKEHIFRFNYNKPNIDQLLLSVSYKVLKTQQNFNENAFEGTVIQCFVQASNIVNYSPHFHILCISIFRKHALDSQQV